MWCKIQIDNFALVAYGALLLICGATIGMWIGYIFVDNGNPTGIIIPIMMMGSGVLMAMVGIYRSG